MHWLLYHCQHQSLLADGRHVLVSHTWVTMIFGMFPLEVLLTVLRAGAHIQMVIPFVSSLFGSRSASMDQGLQSNSFFNMLPGTHEHQNLRERWKIHPYHRRTRTRHQSCCLSATSRTSERPFVNGPKLQQTSAPATTPLTVVYSTNLAVVTPETSISPDEHQVYTWLKILMFQLSVLMDR